MGFFDSFSSCAQSIDQSVGECAATPGAVLLDVRTPEEYAGGHIPGSRNLPLQTLDSTAGSALPDRTVPLFVYCRSGSRSGQAVALLKQKGYHNVRNIGGILSYRGPLETS